MTKMEIAKPPIAAWSSIMTNPSVERIAHTNPEVQLWSIGCEDGRSYIMRAFGPWRPGASLADEYRVLLHLQGAGVPVAVPIVTDDAMLCVKDGDHNYVLAPRLAAEGNGNHELLLKAGDVCFRIGSAIGALHAALAEYPWPVKSYRHDLLNHAFEHAYPKLPEEVRAHSADPHRDVAMAMLRGLPVQLIHGDCNAGNVLLSDGHVSGFIDLDHLPIGQRIYDLSYYLVHCVREVTARPGEQERLGSALLSVVGRYVDGYHAVNALSTAERAAVPAAILAAEISLTSWSHLLLTEMSYRAGPNEPESYANGVSSLDWIGRNFKELANAVG
jgi:Ser/Thr protein kinase RdoA (MazF antagonist)